MSDQPSLLNQAIQAARSGQRDQALQMLLDLVDQDPYNAQGWIHISYLIDDEGDQLSAIENALALLPGDMDLLNRREAHLIAYPHLRRTGIRWGSVPNLENAARLAAQKKYPEAVSFLRDLVTRYPGSEKGWLQLAELEPGLPERTQAVEKALGLNPYHPDGLRLREQLQKEQKNPLERGKYFEEQGEFERAREVYLYLATHSRLATERIEAHRRMEKIDLRQEAHTMQPVHPNLNLFRLAVGPVLLFLLLLFMQSGLNITHLPLIALPGILSVAIGSTLVALTDMVPAHPKWVAWFGKPGNGDEPDMRRGLHLLGWALLFAPYAIFTLDASARLGILQTSLLSGLR